MRQSVLLKVALRAVRDPGFSPALLADPAARAAELGLGRADVEALAGIARDGFEAMIGSLIAHRLLPLSLGRRFLVVPEGIRAPVPTDRLVIRIDQRHTGAWIDSTGTSVSPGMVFGSGSHPTTALALAELENLVRQGDHVLDLGTGSGLLAMAAARLGAARVVACDIDEAAVTNAAANVHANDLDDAVTLVAGSVQALRAGGAARSYNVLVSNILAPAHHKHLADGLSELVAEGGAIVLAGFGSDQVAGLTESLERHGIGAVRVARHDPWAVIVGHKA